MTNEMKQKLQSINATVSSYETGEKWVDSDGTIYNIERKPIDWNLIIKKGDK